MSSINHMAFFLNQTGTSHQQTDEYICHAVKMVTLSYLIFEAPRSLQVFRMHELSLSVPCYPISFQQSATQSKI